VTYIQTTPEKLYQALTDWEFIKRYMQGYGRESDWQVGSAVKWKAVEKYFARGRNLISALLVSCATLSLCPPKSALTTQPLIKKNTTIHSTEPKLTGPKYQRASS